MASREELRRRVGEAILALDEPYRATIWLRFREQLPPRAVARRMGVPGGMPLVIEMELVLTTPPGLWRVPR